MSASSSAACAHPLVAGGARLALLVGAARSPRSHVAGLEGRGSRTREGDADGRIQGPPRLMISAVDPNHRQALGCPVCIVDDEPGVRELLCTLCESVGLAAEAYDCAESFLNAHADQPIKARCLVLDCNLPGMSGLELLNQLNAQGIRLPVLLISGVAETAVVVQALKLGIAGFYRKPFETQELLDRILAFVGRNRAASDKAGTRKRDYRSGFQPFS